MFDIISQFAFIFQRNEEDPKEVSRKRRMENTSKLISNASQDEKKKEKHDSKSTHSKFVSV